MKGLWAAGAAMLLLAWSIASEPRVRLDSASELDALNTQLASLFQHGKYDEAMLVAERLLAISENSLGPNHVDVAKALTYVGGLRVMQQRYGDAQSLFKRALTIREAALGHDHPDVAESLRNLGALYVSQARYDEAEPLLARALAIREAALGGDHPDVTQLRAYLAELRRAQQPR